MSADEAGTIDIGQAENMAPSKAARFAQSRSYVDHHIPRGLGGTGSASEGPPPSLARSFLAFLIWLASVVSFLTEYVIRAQSRHRNRPPR